MEPATNLPSTIDPSVIERAARVIRILGHPLRLRILELLDAGEMNVAQLQARLHTNQAAISQQLAILRSEDVVAPRRDGSRVFYRITEPKVALILDCIRRCDLPDRADAAPRAELTVVTAELGGAGARASTGPGRDGPTRP